MYGQNGIFKLICGLQLLCSASVFAVDGVVEISQVCATQSGCFSGDTPGFPITIDGSAGSSYRLTGDLTIADEDTTGIRITGDNITIDLNGFAIVGVTVCEGSVPPVCSPLGNGFGITSNSRHLSIFNGTIRGMGNACIDPNNFGFIKDLRLQDCGGDGITSSIGFVIMNNTLTGIGGIGIRTDRSVVRNNTISGTASDGIYARSSSVVEGNVLVFAGQDGANGLNLGPHTGYARNTISQTSGPVTGGIEIGVNICGGNTTCP